MSFNSTIKIIIECYHKYSKIIKIIVAFTLLAILFFKVDIFKAVCSFKDIKLIIIIPFILYIPALLLSALKWQLILNKQFPFWFLFKVYWIGNFFSNFLPSTIGGDGYRVIKIIGKIKKERAIASILFDRISGLIATLILFFILSFFFIPYIKNYYIISVTILLLIFICFVIFYLIDLKNFFIYQIIRDIVKDFDKNFGKIFIISFNYLFLGVTSLWCYYFMFGYKLNFFLVAEFYFTIQLVSLIPISINAIGVYEIGLIGLFSLAGVPSEISLSISLLSRIIMLIQTAIGGLLFLLDDKQ